MPHRPSAALSAAATAWVPIDLPRWRSHDLRTLSLVVSSVFAPAKCNSLPKLSD